MTTELVKSKINGSTGIALSVAIALGNFVYSYAANGTDLKGRVERLESDVKDDRAENKAEYKKTQETQVEQALQIQSVKDTGAQILDVVKELRSDFKDFKRGHK